jgi:hypothetical protein
MKAAREISVMTGMLGTPAGLRLVRSEMDELRDHISRSDLRFSREEIAKLDKALRGLGGAIVDMRRVVSAMLAEAGITYSHVG